MGETNILKKKNKIQRRLKLNKIYVKFITNDGMKVEKVIMMMLTFI
jgi:hypothetical protein